VNELLEEIRRSNIGDRGIEEDKGQIFRIDEEEHGRAGKGVQTGSLM